MLRMFLLNSVIKEFVLGPSFGGVGARVGGSGMGGGGGVVSLKYCGKGKKNFQITLIFGRNFDFERMEIKQVRQSVTWYYYF